MIAMPSLVSLFMMTSNNKYRLIIFSLNSTKLVYCGNFVGIGMPFLVPQIEIVLALQA